MTAAVVSRKNRHRDDGLAEYLQRKMEEARSKTAEPPSPPAWLPAEPLERLVAGRGGIGRCLSEIPPGRRRALLDRYFRRAVDARRVRWFTGDRLAVELLGLHPFEVWGEEWLMDPP